VADDFINFSDQRLKHDIAPLSSTLQKVMQLRPVQFRYKPAHTIDQRLRYGLIAQEVERIFPSMVIQEDTDRDPDTGEILRKPTEHKAMNYLDLIAVLVQATQEQQAHIEALEAKVRALKAAKDDSIIQMISAIR
jgi:hypothetical protein